MVSAPVAIAPVGITCGPWPQCGPIPRDRAGIPGSRLGATVGCLTRVGSLIASSVAFLTCVGAGFGRPLHERYSGISGALVLQRRHRDCE